MIPALRRDLLFLLTLALGAAIDTAIGSAGAGNEFLQQTINAQNIQRVHIQAPGGQIRVRGWDRQAVGIREAREAIKGVLAATAGTELDISSPEQGALFVDLYVPARLDVTVSSPLADVFLHGISGQIDATTDAGDIHLYENSGKVRAVSNTGQIRLLLPTSFQSAVDLQSRSGDIHAILNSEDVKIHAVTGGAIFFNGQSRATGLSASQEVVLEMTTSSTAALQLSSATGRIVIQSQQPAPDSPESAAVLVAQAGQNRPAVKPHPESNGGPAAQPQPQMQAQHPGSSSGADIVPVPAPSTPGTTLPTSSNPNSSYKVGGEAVDSGYTVRTSVDYVNLNVSVRDRANRAVASLRREDFMVYEDGRLQQVEKLLTAEAPFSLLLLLDVSGSTSGFTDLMKQASISFLRQLKPQDEVAVAVFNSDVRLLAEFSDSRADAERAIGNIHSRGGTAFYDALETSIHDYMAHIRGRKAVVVFSDGVDNQMEGRGSGSTTTFNQLLRGIQEIDTIIYPIFLDTEEDVAGAGGGWGRILIDILNGGIYRRPVPIGRQSRREDYQRAREEMAALAEQTGGRMYSPHRIEDLAGIYRQIADDLRIQYTLSYVSTNAARDGKWRRIQVRIQGYPEYFARTRLGYYAADERRARGQNQ